MNLPTSKFRSVPNLDRLILHIIHKAVRRTQKNRISGVWMSKHLKIKQKDNSVNMLISNRRKKTQWQYVSAFSYFLQFTFISFLPPLYKDKSRSGIGGHVDGAVEDCFLVGCDAVCVSKEGRLYLPISTTSRHGRNRFSEMTKFMPRAPKF
jgi:hypothetical protein